MHHKIHKLPFIPLIGFSSPHAQTAISCFCPGGSSPPSELRIISLPDGDSLSCEISTPQGWTTKEKTILLVHGLGGAHDSSYMIRLSRKCYERGYRAIRLNMRCCGHSTSYATRPYHGGISGDLKAALELFKKEAMESPMYVVGFSLGGNIALKLAGELGSEANKLLAMTIAVCPPIDLGQTSAILSRPNHLLYNRYYMKHLANQTEPWTKDLTFNTIYDYDQLVTAPNWNFKSPNDYYKKCSSLYYLPSIRHETRLIFAADDPFIDYRCCVDEEMTSDVSLWVSENGGHMGFLGWSDEVHRYFWLDYLITSWLDEK